MHIDAELTGINQNYQLPAISLADVGANARPANLTGLNPHHPLVAAMTVPPPASQVAVPVPAPDGGLVATTIIVCVVTMCIFTLLSVLLTPGKRPAVRVRRPY
jgi:hypothetical protein